MTLPISNVIRRMRRERDITQENLAEAVGVPYQSVSRWENGQAYPDMELIPKIAKYFEIYTDVLFGMDNESTSKKIDKHYQKIKEVQNNHEEFYLACKSAYDEFPNEFNFGIWLCRCYVDYGIRPNENHIDEIRHICRNILDNSTNEDLRIEALYVIAIAETDENLDSWLNMMPSWKSCKEILLESRYAYHRDMEKYRLSRQENFITLIGYLFYNCNEWVDHNIAIDNYKMILSLIDVMREPNTDIDAWIVMRAHFHARLAGEHFALMENDLGFIEFEKAIDLYVKYAELPIDISLTYNCSALNLLTENKLSKPEDDTNDKGEYECFWAYYDFMNPEGLFVNVWNDDRFKLQIERLKPYLPSQD